MRKGATLTIAIMIMPAILWARSDDIPNLDVRPVCRGIASQSASNPADVGIKTSFEQCIQSEQAVREQLKQVRSQPTQLRTSSGSKDRECGHEDDFDTNPNLRVHYGGCDGGGSLCSSARRRPSSD